MTLQLIIKKKIIKDLRHKSLLTSKGVVLICILVVHKRTNVAILVHRLFNTKAFILKGNIIPITYNQNINISKDT